MKKLSAVLLTFIICLFSFDFGTFASENDFVVSYRDALNKAEMTVYDTFLNNLEKMKDGKTEIKIRFPENISKDDISGVLQRSSAAFVLDHPECFWLSYEKLSFSYIEADGGVSVITARKDDENEYYFPSDFSSRDDVEREAALVKEKIDEIVEASEKYPSSYEKIKYFHDWLCKNNAYNEYVLNGNEESADQSAWRALSALTSGNDAEKGPVCEGYAKAFKILCDNVGIPCVLIPGDGISNDAREAHMWCTVMLSGEWYGVDVTWDDAVTSNGVNVMRDNYFLCGADDEDFSNTHIPDMEKYFMTSLPTPKLAEKRYEPAENDGGSFLTVTGFSAVYGEKAEVKLTLSDNLACEKITLYKNCVADANKIYEVKTENTSLTVKLDTSVLSCVNDKRITAVCEDEKGNVYTSCDEILVLPKMLELDESSVTVLYTDSIPQLSGELISKTGQKLSYELESKVSEDEKSMILEYTDIAPLDMNYTTKDTLTLEFELPNEDNRIYIYIIPALIVIFCAIVSLLKRK